MSAAEIADLKSARWLHALATELRACGKCQADLANAAKGRAVITNASTGAFVYTPNLNADGTDSFTFVANDGTEIGRAHV